MEPLVTYFFEGGWVMWPILGCSLLSIAIMIERAVRLQRARVFDDDLIRSIHAALQAGNAEQAAKIGMSSGKLCGRALAKGLDDYVYTASDVETALTGAAERELRSLWNHMLILNLIGRVGVLLGLFGTVIGMVKGFQGLAADQVAKEKVAEAVSVALITTVGGLCVTIPAIVAETGFKVRIRTLTGEFEELLVQTAKAMQIGGVRKGKQP